MQSHIHTMQQAHVHKAVTGRIETKKLLSRQRQSDCRRLVPAALVLQYRKVQGTETLS